MKLESVCSPRGWDFLPCRNAMTTSYLYGLRRSSVTWPCPPLSPCLAPCPPHPLGSTYPAFQFISHIWGFVLRVSSLHGALSLLGPHPMMNSTSHDEYFSSSIPLSLLQRGAKSTQNTISLSWCQIRFPYNLFNRLLILFLVSNYYN